MFNFWPFNVARKRREEAHRQAQERLIAAFREDCQQRAKRNKVIPMSDPRHPRNLSPQQRQRIKEREAVLEHAQADFQPLVLELLRVHPGALVNAEMRRDSKIDGYEVVDKAYAEYGIVAEDFEVVNFARWCAENSVAILRGEQ